MYRKYLHLPISFFEINTALSNKLAQDATLVQNLCSDVIGIVLQAISSFLTGITIAFFYSWKLALVSIALSPLGFLSGRAVSDLAKGFSDDSDESFKKGALIV